MRALVYGGGNEASLEEVGKPVPGTNEALLRILRSSICGTDLSILAGKHPRAKAGLIMGHEIVARIEETDDEDFQVGDLVTVEPIVSCGTCVACLSGFPHVCSSLKLYGIDIPGGMADYMVCDTANLWKIPEELSVDIAAFIEPLAVAVHAVRRSSLKFDDAVCVIGGGPIGMLTALIAQEHTTRPILISEPDASRRAIAGRLGFQSVNPIEEDLLESIARNTDGRGCDITFEAAGSQPAILAATKTLRPRGTLVQIAMPKVLMQMNIVDLTFKELNVIGVRVYEAYDFERAINFLAARQEVFNKILPTLFRLEQFPAAFEAAKKGTGGLRFTFAIGE